MSKTFLLVAVLCSILSATASGQRARASAPAPAQPAPVRLADAPPPRVERGELQRGDKTLESGEFVDSYTFRATPNQRVSINLSSPTFDGYLVLVPPKGEQVENDDTDSPNHSAIEADLDQFGTYRILVTSYEEGETGAYDLRITLEDRAAGASPVAARRTEAASIAYGQTKEDRLERSDPLDGNNYIDSYAFEGRTGERIAVDLASEDFDTYLTVIPPDGGEIANDDVDGSQDLSRVELTLQATGRYRVIVSSYDPRETGDYQLTLRRTAVTATRESRTLTSATGRGRIFGIFVGISDYAGDDNDLEYTADDARALQDAMTRGVGLRPEDSVLLTDRAATVSRVRSAIQDAARKAGPDDLVVFFFSGHGDQAAHDTTQAADPDGFDETLTFYDDDLTDDEMNSLLAGIRGRVLLVLDSCFSGGFSKDVISSPRRMGLFSSEEDVTSGVADKFRAGGYLAKFMAEAVGDRRADKNRNGEITAIELSQYVHERYRSDVKSSSANENFVRTSGPQTGYQHLVVDRGSIGPYDILFRREQ
ncbi:MAG TPA: caspase family protein [Vicinamibacterales bacterium]|nr:caspase family protein [Vicinamibacterales bacterium]